MIELSPQEIEDLICMMADMAGLKTEQLDDIGKDHPFSDPEERDEIRECLRREIDLALKIASYFESNPQPTTHNPQPTSNQMSNDNSPRPYTVTLTAIVISTPEEMETADHGDLYWIMSGRDGCGDHIEDTIQEWIAPPPVPAEPAGGEQ